MAEPPSWPEWHAMCSDSVTKIREKTHSRKFSTHYLKVFVCPAFERFRLFAKNNPTHTFCE